VAQTADRPRTPTQLTRQSWWGALKRSFDGFREQNLTDWAAALTYYAVLSIFPALIALVALLGLVGQYPQTTNALLRIVDDVGPSSAVDVLRDPIEGVVKSKSGAGALFGFGLLGAVWSASGYIGAFTRASNAIYEVREGRPFWKRRPAQLLITAGMVLLLALMAVAVVLTGDLAKAVGDEVGVGDTAVTVWSYVKWPVLAAMAMFIFALLYYVAPNVRHHGFRWITPGSVLAVGLWVLASLGFALYVAHFGAYNKTYGVLGAMIVFLVWLWVTNVAVLAGAEFDSELERSRELEQGTPIEETLTLEPKSEPG
jgi:membrane protein